MYVMVQTQGVRHTAALTRSRGVEGPGENQ